MKILKEIGLIGLGVMGKNIALNLSDNGVVIKGFNDSREKLDEIKKEFSGTFESYTDINDLISNLSRPRTILLMVPSGKATKDVIEKIAGANMFQKSYFLISGRMEISPFLMPSI